MKGKIFFLLFAAVIALGCVQQAGRNETAQPNQMGPEAQPGVKQFSMIIGHTFYNPATLTVDKGDTVVIKAVAAPGTASHLHGITIDEYGVNEAVATEDTNNPQIIQFVADKEGFFTIYCKTCWSGPYGRGHPDIRGVLEVKP
ncbi:MAG: hypothetical protein HY517_04400 [Candidatus Aenigmarchaeota archaeon]|nr:hypothetical protein [Candidatus Aenigmarchaeota archaeon]MBI4174860.1 hypothetical protein [Candidatus Aenigmarchaeota archaeon]